MKLASWEMRTVPISHATLLSVKKNYKAGGTTTPEGTDIHILKGSRWPSNAASVIRLQLQ